MVKKIASISAAARAPEAAKKARLCGALREADLQVRIRRMVMRIRMGAGTGIGMSADGSGKLCE